MPSPISRYHSAALLDVWTDVRALPAFDSPEYLAAGTLVSINEDIEA